MKLVIKLLPLIIIPLFLSCKKNKEKLKWNIDAIAPLFYGELSIKDILKDSIIKTNSDNTLQLNFNTNIYKLEFDSLLKIPDTTIREKHYIPFSSGINCAPGQLFLSNPEDIYFNISEAEITKVKLKSGEINYTIQSNIEGDVIYDYTIYNAIGLDGQNFTKTITVPASNNNNISSLTGKFDLTGYTINLRGVNNNLYNTLSTFVKMKLSENHNGNLLITNQDSVVIINKIENLKIEYAEGYFGNKHTSISNNKIHLKQLNNITNGNIDLSQVNIDIDIINGIGADASFKINNLNSISTNANIPLSHTIIGSENHINRAQKDLYGNITPFIYTSNINSSNSNIEQWIENIPDSVYYSLDLELNPLGNISGHYDFIKENSPFEMNMKIDMPLSFLANNLTLVDTIELNTKNIEQLIKGKIIFEIENGFPLEATLSIKNINNSEELFSNNKIKSAILNTQGKVIEKTISKCEIIFTEQSINNIKNNKKLILNIKFDSPNGYGHLDIYDYYNIKFKSIADFTYQNSIE